MAYQVLARKLRPTDFSALVGQDHVVQALTHALDNDRLHHAYLFTGTRGVGKTTIARILARCLNCERGVSATPCNECASCVAISEGRAVDLIEMDGASQRGIDNIHELQDGTQYAPTSARFKVYLIDEVHMLTGPAFNALLKTLEEPPPHVKFLFATTEAKKVPVTILSRCLQFQLKNLPAERISAYLAEALESEGVAFEAGALRVIANAAEGSMRDALSVTDQAISFGGGQLTEASVADMLGVTGRDEVAALLDALAAQNSAGLLACAAELAERGADFGTLLADLMAALHSIAVAQLVPERSADDDLGQQFAGRIDPEAVQLYYQITLRGHRDLAFSPDPRIGFEMTLLRMLNFVPAPPPGDRAVPPAPQARAPAAQTTATAGAPQPSDAPVARARPASVAAAPAAAAPRHPATDALPPAPDPYFSGLVRNIGTQGVLTMLLQHSVLVARAAEGEGERWSLRLDPAHDALLNDRHSAQLAQLLSGIVGHAVSVDLDVAAPEWETPALQRQREQAERRAAAIQELRDDASVQSLMSTFGAELDEASIQPRDGDAPAPHTGDPA